MNSTLYRPRAEIIEVRALKMKLNCWQVQVTSISTCCENVEGNRQCQVADFLESNNSLILFLALHKLSHFELFTAHSPISSNLQVGSFKTPFLVGENILQKTIMPCSVGWSWRLIFASFKVQRTHARFLPSAQRKNKNTRQPETNKNILQMEKSTN